jgi:hypothetical protein
MKNKKYNDYRLYVTKKLMAVYNEAVKADREFEDAIRWCAAMHLEAERLTGYSKQSAIEFANSRFLTVLNNAHWTKRELMKVIQAGMKKLGLIVKEGGAE